MNTPLSWIKAYVPELECTEQEYMDAMTLSGTKVEGYEKFDADLDKIIVGKIEKIEKHPDADKLVVCQVASRSGRRTGGRRTRRQEDARRDPDQKGKTPRRGEQWNDVLH